MVKKGLFLLFLLFLVSCDNKEEKIYEKELMNIEVSGYDNSKQFSGSDVKEIKNILRKKFDNLELIAVTKDGRFFIRKNVTDGKNKELTGKEVTIDRVDIIDTIGEWCEEKGIEFKFIINQFYDKKQNKEISRSIYYSHILQIKYEEEDYKKALKEGFSKYSRATRF